ncbi:MAG: amino acid adenylation domain-containing protein [Nitrosospira sp.]|nr:amino acid adenylation domain-containing protein [Nitrosospira sp.]
MDLNKQDIAERFSALPAEKQKEFLGGMKKRGLDFSLLPIVRQKTGKRSVLSYAQQRHWFLWQLEPLSTAYHLSGGLRLVGKLDMEALGWSFQSLVERHESLRTVFRADADGLPEQIIEAEPKLDIPIIDLSGLAAGQRTARAHEEASRISVTPFDLTQGPLLRIVLVRISMEEHLLVVVMHHIISDAWSNRIVIDEFAAQYRARIQGQELSLPSLPIQYADYAIWQRNWLEAGEKERQLTYWRSQLGEEHPILQLPTDHPRPSTANYRAARHTFALPAALVARLQRQAQSEGATLFMALLAGFQALLQRYTGQHDIRVGVPIANRHRVEIENIVGFFVNTQVLRNRIDGRMPLKVILDQAREAALGAQTHQDLPFEQLVEALQPERNLNQNPLFQVMYNHLREDYRALEQLPGLVVENHELSEQTAQFELTLDTVEQPDGRLEATFTYAGELFEPTTIRRLGGHYLHLLQQLAEYPERSLGDIDILSEGERAQVRAWGVNERRYPNAEPVHCLIERQVEARPEAVALIFGDTKLSYAELNRRANRLAHRLIGLGVEPETRVGIAVERSIDMIVGLLAVLKAGGAYVPLDPEYPRERLKYMAADSAISLLLTQSQIRGRIPNPAACEVLELDRLDLAGEPESNPAVSLHGDNLAYVIYTSGSTGKPKGVGVTHGPLAMHVQAIGDVYGMTAEDRELQFASINFDGAHERWLVPLAFGAALMPRDNDLWPVDRTVAEIARHGITIACFTPGYLHQLAELAGKTGRSLPIRSYTVGGEAMSRASFDFVQEILQPPRIINGYGPTETVITPLISKAYPGTGFESAYMPIGHPVGDRTAYILDPDLNPVPQGVAGELYLGGAGLARGYLNRGELTAERFIADPFDGKGGRLYRTGDLTRWRSDGQIEYLGRLDHQVKIRGFRIELGEIEAQLLVQPEVREAVVIAGEGPGATGGRRLVGYVSLHSGASADTAGLREAIGKALPDYMIPSAIVVLDSLPLNPNGKVDRKALPEPGLPKTDHYEAPQGEAEEALASIWAQVLGIGQVGRNDNFFELGGDSILSLQIVTKARRAGWKITPRQLFERQTIAELAPRAEATVTIQAHTRISTAGVMGEVPLLPIQIEFFEQGVPARHHWNQAVLLKSRQPLHPGCLAQALEALMHHHDALRFRYVEHADGGWQQISVELAAWNLLWERKAASAKQFEALCNEAQRSLNLAEGPLLRGLLIDMADGAQRLLLVIHHLVIDGVSWRILLEDLQAAYNSARNDEAIYLPSKTASYQAWTHRLQSYVRERPGELAYWQSLAGAPVALPKDHPHAPNSVHHQASVTLTLDRTQTQALLKQAPTAYRTQVNDLLLTALGSALCQWSGHEKILVDLEGHGREDLYEDIDLSQTVGWFTTLYPVVLDPSGDLDQKIKRIKEYLRGIPNKGLGYGLFKSHGTPEQREVLASLPKPEVVFNYLGQFDASFDEKALWILTDESVGDSMDRAAPLGHDISINGGVYEGELSLSVSYSDARYQKATVEAFINLYRAELEVLIVHCTNGTAGVTPSDFLLARIRQHELDDFSIPAAQIEDLYPLSPMQAGMLFHSIFDKDDNNVYLNQLRADIERLDGVRFKAAWQAAVDRHNVLRTGFVIQDGKPLQWVAKNVDLPFVEYDWRERANQEGDLETLAQAEHNSGFDLAKPPLMRLALVRLASDRYHLIWTVHHLLLDGWSTSRLVGEVLREYSGCALSVDRKNGRYRDFIEWLQNRDMNASEAYWRKRLATVAESIRLVDALRIPLLPPSTNTSCDEYVSELGQTVTGELVRFAKRERVTLNTLVQAVWAMLLNRYTGKQTVVFGTTVAGRPTDLPGAEQLLGLFINTLPVTASLQPEQEIGPWLRDLQAQNLASREYEHTPLYEIQRWLGQSGKGLFDTILVFENYPMDEALRQALPGGLVFSGVRNREATNYPMTVSVTQSDTLLFNYSYARKHFSRGIVSAMAAQINKLLGSIARGLVRKLGDIDILSEGERAQLKAWGVNEGRHGNTESVHSLIERQVEARPEAVALIFGDIKLSYAELNRQSNRLAHRLIRLGVKPETKVGIAVERSIDMVVGLLAILKAGGVYIPLEPEYPQERLNYMVADSAIGLLLTQSPIKSLIPVPAPCRVLELDVLDLEDEPESNPQVCLHGENLAYVIYTSGSTGKPKGVGNRHRSLYNRLAWMQEAHGLSQNDTVLQKTPFSFDVSVWEFFLPLMYGARLAIVAPGDHRDPGRLISLILQQHVTTLHFVPSMLQAFIAHEGIEACATLRRIICSGEVLPAEVQKKVFKKLPGARLYNLYGPTEAAIDVTQWQCVDNDDHNNVPIGQPISGIQTYILDPQLNLVPAGVAGELYLGGIGLARCYLNRRGLTAERFIADPFDEGGGRLYRTGDLARWRADGQIEYLGRLDYQVKIRGFRIELGEIETQLLAQPEVREAVVVAREAPSEPNAAGGARLIAYISPHAGATVDVALLREALAKILPDYMIPSAIVVLESLPLNPNGKVDRQALPEPEFGNTDSYEAPQGEVEEVLTGIWAGVLGVEQVGRHDNFFELGGDSILSLQIVNRARRAGWKITPRQLFERQTIALLAEVAETEQETIPGAVKLERGYLRDHLNSEAIAKLPFTDNEIEDVYPLSPTQEGMLFHTLETAADGTGLYVNQLSVEVDGLDPQRFTRSWQVMVARHPVLRTGFLWEAGLARPLQIVFKKADPPVSHLDWRGLDRLELRIAEYAEEELKREFDFLVPPLARLALIRLAEDRYQLIWTRHHILLDAWGDSVLISEWLRSYDGQGLSTAGPDYGHYVRWLAKQDVQMTRAFWQAELAGVEGPTLLSQATSRAGKRNEQDMRSGFTQIYTRLSLEETSQLKAFAQGQQVTLNTVVQAAWALLLQRYTGKDTVVFGATVAGRPPSLSKADEILGMFINTIPVPVERRSDLTTGEYLGLLQKTNARLREHEHASLADIQRWAGSPGRPLFDSIVVFENYPIDEAMRGNELYGVHFGEIEGKGLTGYAMDLAVVVGDTLEIEYCYGRNDFSDEFVLDLRRHMEFLMRKIMSHPQRPVGELGWMERRELDNLFSLGRNAQGADPRTLAAAAAHLPAHARHPVHRMIEHNAALQPDAIALLMAEQELSYSRLNIRANRLAHRLISMGASPEVRVGVAMERSLDVIVALLAVLKAGSAYVPLDPEYPVDRLAFMMEDSALSLVITQSKLLPKLASAAGVRTLVLDSVDLSSEADSNPDVSINQHNLAYVIYTSGSTGLPKGVAVTHGPLAMHCGATAEIYGMGPHSCELLFMSFSFDGAHERWLTALTVGAGLAVRDQELWTAEQTYDALHSYGVTNAAFPPAYLGQVAEWAAPRSDPPPVELYVFGGEAMPKASYDLIRQTLRPRILINGYGPTETVVTPLIWKTEASNSFDCAYAPIGRPVGERTAYVLDVDMQPVPIGMVGELYIGGYGLARGYLGRAGLTAERFVADPFDDNGGRLYRTGDIVRWLNDGNIEYIGRGDHQVKIRGFRIELGEIEARIREASGIADVAVVVREGAAGPQLAAYVVPLVASANTQSNDLPARLKQELGKYLPEYMLPAHFVKLDVLPRLPSGKLDHQALPEPGAIAVDTYRAPSTDQARALAKIWQEVLGVERVGETDNFFALGGDSLSSLKVMARMRSLPYAELGFKLRDLMQRPTIGGLLGLDIQPTGGMHALLALNQPTEKEKTGPLFCIHAGFGTVFDYQPLARLLQGKRTVYGLPCRMLADPGHRDTSLDQMAADYCRILRGIQPEGPYHLLGWSLGGTLAAMIASLLEADAQTVAFLGLIDLFVPGAEPAQSNDWRGDFSDFVSVVIPSLKADEIMDKVVGESSFDNNQPAELEQVSEREIAGLLESLISAEQMRTRERDGIQTGGYADMGAEELVRIFAVARHLKALSLQMPGLNSLKVQPACWWATGDSLSSRLALALQINQERLCSADIDADHFGIIRADSLLSGIESALDVISLMPEQNVAAG